VTLRFQDQDFSWKFLLADVAFPILGVDFLRAHEVLIYPEGHALLDSTGRRFAGQLLRSPPTATVVIGFVQPYKPMAETSSPSAQPTSQRWSSQRQSSQRRSSQRQSSQRRSNQRRSSQRWSSQRRSSQRRTSYCSRRAGSLGGSGRKTDLRVVRCRLERGQTSW
jgi:hypothetical protein